MLRHLKISSLILLLSFVVAFARSAAAQSVAIQLSGNGASLQTTSPSNLGFRFQVSENNANWEDISDQAAGSVPFRIDATKNQKRFFRLRTWTTEDAPISLVIIGDSTVADFASNWNMFYGWGHGIYGYLKPNVQAVNLSVPFQSTKTFLTSIQKDSLAAIKPDFVLVQFGMVDLYDLEHTKTTVPEYEANLKTIIQIIRDFKGTPILVTPPVVRVFDGTGKVGPWMEDRCAVMRKLSAELQTYLIDLNQLSKNLFDELGPVASAYITWNDADPAHFTEAGAGVIAGLVAKAFPSILRSQVVD